MLSSPISNPAAIAFIADNRDKLYQYTKARRIPEEDIQDILQDLWLRLAQSAAQSTDHVQIASLVYVSLRNLITDYHRLRKRVGDMPEFGEESADGEIRAEPDQFLGSIPLMSPSEGRILQMQIILEIIAAMPVAYQIALDYYVQGYTCKEEAELRNQRESQVKCRRFRAIRRLRKRALVALSTPDR